MTDVIVVGAGVIGLTAAVRLVERGARVTVLSAHDPSRIVSSVAAAVWYPTHVDPDPRLPRWAAASYDEFRRQATGGVPDVLMRRTRMLRRRTDDALPWWAPAVGDVEVRDAPAPYTRQLRFAAPLVRMEPYLRWLANRLTAGGGRLVRQRVHRLDDLFSAAPVVVNATGLAARALCADDAVVPVRGQTVLVANPGLDESVRDEDDPAGSTYLHPRGRDVVLGGSYEVGREDVEPDAGVRAGILRRCVALEPRLAGASVLGERIGLRPVRRGGPRVEAGDLPGGRLVHAYGHGGAGMTLSWGCADTVTELALGRADEATARCAPP